MKWSAQRRNPRDFRRKFIWWPIRINCSDGTMKWYWLEFLLATATLCHHDGTIRYFKNLDGSDV